ncbi:MAG: hypothetical protein KF693_15830 [Nitrospira sp.]|nr:hypothetical protein [Nitrospira sp.]
MIIRVLIATTFLLLVASTAGQIARHVFGHPGLMGVVPLFYVDEEGNIPTFFSASLLLYASLLLALISRLEKKSNGSRWRQWTILAFALLYMAIDEASEIHELLQTPAKWLIGRQNAKGVLTYAWVLFGITFILAFVLSYLKFFFSLPSRTRKQFFAAAAVFLSGGLGMELVESYYVGTYGRETFGQAILVTVEEGLEMAGVIILINALLTYIHSCYGDVRLRFA